jgi:hypothetical protein
MTDYTKTPRWANQVRDPYAALRFLETKTYWRHPDPWIERAKEALQAVINRRAAKKAKLKAAKRAKLKVIRRRQIGNACCRFVS